MQHGSLVIIAEAGVNHNGSVARALELVNAAADVGADIVKFQTFLPEEIAIGSAPLAEYQRGTSRGNRSQREMLSELVLEAEDWVKIRDRCEERGIEFLSTAFDRESLKLILGLGVSRLKVPSGEITHRRFLEDIARTGLPIILSTGMSDLNEVRQAINVLVQGGVGLDLLTVLQCTSAYPAPPSDLNLRAMVTMHEEFLVNVGLSDHSLGVEAAIAAVALGAVVIEKHITLNRNDTGPDHAASMEPQQFGELVEMLRRTEVALGDGTKRCSASEFEVRKVARRSLVATQRIEAGTPLSDQVLAASRPGIGVSPMEVDRYVGTTATRAFEQGELIE